MAIIHGGGIIIMLSIGENIIIYFKYDDDCFALYYKFSLSSFPVNHLALHHSGMILHLF